MPHSQSPVRINKRSYYIGGEYFLSHTALVTYLWRDSVVTYSKGTLVTQKPCIRQTFGEPCLGFSSQVTSGTWQRPPTLPCTMDPYYTLDLHPWYMNHFLFVFVCLFRTTLSAHGSSQAKGQIRAVAVSLHHSHSNARWEPRLRSTPRLMATPNP